MKNKRKEGFTLIELLIVIGIIAILAAAVIIAINPGQQFKQARNATRWSHMNSVANAVYSYVISSGGSYPDCIEGAATIALGNLTGTFPVNPRDIVNCQTDLSNHIGNLPRDPQTGVADGATGYSIDFDGVRIKISSTADEANVEGNKVEVIQ